MNFLVTMSFCTNGTHAVVAVRRLQSEPAAHLQTKLPSCFAQTPLSFFNHTQQSFGVEHWPLVVQEVPHFGLPAESAQHKDPAAQQVDPHACEAGQHEPLMQASVGAQHDAPQARADGQQTPLTQVSPVEQHDEPHCCPDGQVVEVEQTWLALQTFGLVQVPQVLPQESVPQAQLWVVHSQLVQTLSTHSWLELQHAEPHFFAVVQVWQLPLMQDSPDGQVPFGFEELHTLPAATQEPSEQAVPSPQLAHALPPVPQSDASVPDSHFSPLQQPPQVAESHLATGVPPPHAESSRQEATTMVSSG